MGYAQNEHWHMERTRIRLVHEVIEKVHHAIIWTKNKFRLKEEKKTLQEQVHEALEQDGHEDDPNIDQTTTIYAKKLNRMLHASTNYRGERFQKKMFEKLVCEPFLNGVMPNFVINHKTLLECAIICSSLDSA